MTSSESEIDIPSTPEIEASFREVIKELYDARDLDNLTVKRIRAAAEKQLALPANFFRHSSEWKDRSKDFIETEVRARETSEPLSPPPGKSKPTKRDPPSAKSSLTKNGPQSVNSTPSKQAAKKIESSGSSQGKKRAHQDEKPVTRKKRKTTVPSDTEDGSDVENPADKGVTVQTTGRVRRGGRKIINSDDEMQDGTGYQSDTGDKLSSPAPQPKRGRKPKAKSSTPITKAAGHQNVPVLESDLSVLTDKSAKNTVVKKSANGKMASPASPKPLKEKPKGDISESEMSSLIDEPPKKKRERKSHAPKSKSSKPRVSKTATGPLDPQEAEIKKLQGWLVQCGIRKLWHRELASCSSSREKISHLKGMLKDVGIDGRFSKEKAAQIRARRELEADLEEVNQFAAKYGDTQRGSRPRRAVPSMSDLGFGSDDDGVETD